MNNEKQNNILLRLESKPTRHWQLLRFRKYPNKFGNSIVYLYFCERKRPNAWISIDLGYGSERKQTDSISR